MTATILEQIVRQIQQNLRDDLRRSKYRGNQNQLAGHCYVASEVLYQLLGAQTSEYRPAHIRVNGEVHWFLQNSTGSVVDPTAGQFEFPLDYTDARRCGFLTKLPSKRAQDVLDKLRFKGA